MTARSAIPPRLMIAEDLDDGLSGAWWPRTASIADELSPLAAALRDPLGQVVDISVNWSSCDGVIDLDLLWKRGVSALPGMKSRPQRMMTVTGSDASARLIVIPSRTTTPLATLVLRHAAGFAIDSRHHESALYRAAEDIVLAARTQCTQSRETARR